MQVGELDGTSQPANTGNHVPLANVTVNAAWSGGITGTGKCTTGSNGQCSITSGRVPLQAGSVNFTVTKAARSSYLYLASANHDPETDSNGTAITLYKP